VGGMGTGGAGGMGTGGAGGMGTGGAGGMGTGGAGGMGPMVPQTAFYFGDFINNGDDQLGRVDFPGGTPSTVGLMGITTLDEIDAFAISPDATQFAIALFADGNPVSILVYDIDATSAPITVATAGAANFDVRELAWSPDGSRIAFVGDWDLNGADRVYVANADGTSASPTLVSQNPSDAARDAVGVVWVDNTTVAYRADLVDDGEDNVYSSDITLSPPVPVPLIPEALTADGSEARDTPQVDASGKVYFRSTHLGGAFLLFRADPDGQNLEQVAAMAALTNGNGPAQVGAFRLTPDGMGIAFGADAPTADLYQVYVASDVDLAASTVRTNVQTAAVAAELRGPLGDDALEWAPDGSALCVVTDWQVNGVGADNDNAAFIVPTSGTAGGIRIVTAALASNNQDVNECRFSGDGARVFLRGDLIDNNDTEVFTTADLVTADQAPAGLLLQNVAVGGDVRDLVARP
ncbi:MAG: hypothetical protein AAGN82_30700, partial [Myxococcota bacterium]